MMKVTTTTALARDAIRCVRATASGCGIAGPAALRLADAADVLIEENERMRALLLRFREAAASVREQAMAKVTAAHDDDTQYLREILPGFDEIMSRIDAAIGEEK